MEDTKKCPICGKEINSIAHKCRYCGNWIEKQCPSCGKWIDINEKQCKICGQLFAATSNIIKDTQQPTQAKSDNTAEETVKYCTIEDIRARNKRQEAYGNEKVLEVLFGIGLMAAIFGCIKELGFDFSNINVLRIITNYSSEFYTMIGLIAEGILWFYLARAIMTQDTSSGNNIKGLSITSICFGFFSFIAKDSDNGLIVVCNFVTLTCYVYFSFMVAYKLLKNFSSVDTLKNIALISTIKCIVYLLIFGLILMDYNIDSSDKSKWVIFGNLVLDVMLFVYLSIVCPSLDIENNHPE